jgi:hypothetical protein
VALDAPIANPASVLIRQMASVWFVTSGATLIEKFPVGTLVLVRIVAGGASHRLAFLEATTFHEPQQLVGSVWIVVLGIIRIHIQLQKLFERFAGSIRERGPQRSPNSRVALGANFVGSDLRQT